MTHTADNTDRQEGATMTHADYVRELVTRITTSERTYEHLANQEWAAYDVLAAVRHRAMAEGLVMARDHMLAIAQESRSSGGGTTTSSEEQTHG